LHRAYHFPTVGAYPRVVPNYIAFRYDGKLQSIHHVDDYRIVHTLRPHPGGARDDVGRAPLLATARLPIRPDQETRTGKGIARSARVTVDIDLLLTSATITEARDATKALARRDEGQLTGACSLSLSVTR